MVATPIIDTYVIKATNHGFSRRRNGDAIMFSPPIYWGVVYLMAFCANILDELAEILDN